MAGLKDAEEVTVWEKHKEGIMSEYIWAPVIHYLNRHAVLMKIQWDEKTGTPIFFMKPEENSNIYINCMKY